ncbi:helix-turn-helix domain-containing protein [Vibrio cholerae]|nr:helix-turn-helix domain-containing protein [Vibrio cholerae]
MQWSTHAVDTAGTTLLTFSPAASEAGSPGVEPSLRLVPPPSSPFRSREAVRSALYTAMRKRFQDPAFSAADLAAEAHLSVRSLQSLFREVDRSPAAEIRRLRLDHARAMLERGHSVRASCVGSGYLDPDSFSRAFRRHFGCSPSEVRGYGPFDHAA